LGPTTLLAKATLLLSLQAALNTLSMPEASLVECIGALEKMSAPCFPILQLRGPCQSPLLLGQSLPAAAAAVVAQTP
jgi:hypothetical protein